jgi:asparagine synthase (glutamine-hydrolysing)
MTAALAHRGPNAQGLQAWRGAAIGHRRLSIIDLVTGDQPIFSEDGRKAVVLNGEIYNFQGLRILLEAHGHRFATRSDTEVIVHAYEEYGVGCVERLEGMFAFAVGRQRAAPPPGSGPGGKEASVLRSGWRASALRL